MFLRKSKSMSDKNCFLFPIWKVMAFLAMCSRFTLLVTLRPITHCDDPSTSKCLISTTTPESVAAFNMYDPSIFLTELLWSRYRTASVCVPLNLQE